MFWVVALARSAELPPGEYQLKAAFLFNFAKFVDWPENAFAETNSPLVIGILGQNPFGQDLEKLVQNKSIGSHPLVVETLTSAAQARSCHILFVSNSETPHLREVFGGLRKACVLTVGENERFVESGGMINFVIEGKKIRFEINDSAAKEAGLKVSSKLLSLAARSPR